MGVLRRSLWPIAAVTLAAASALPAGAQGVGAERTVTLQAEPCIRGLSTVGTYPLAITVTNPGPATTAEITIDSRNELTRQRSYRLRVDLPGGGAKRTVFAYPNLGGGGFYHHDLRVTLSGPTFGKREALLSSPYGGGGTHLCLVGDRSVFGTLRPVQRGSDRGQRPLPYQDSYVQMERAPDRAVGYDGVTTLVLGRGAERLRPEQWQAIRDWVVRGGSLVLLDGGNLALQTPQAAELSPVLPGMVGPGWHAVAETKPGAERLNGTSGGVHRARRQLGIGTVLYCATDLTAKTYRSSQSLPQLWRELMEQATPFIRARDLHGAAVASAIGTENSPWRTTARASDADPFHVRLPSLRAVLFVFLGYFVLAVPVTFVVLKRRRRMNLAWATGPALAVLTAGSLYLFTAHLYSARLSRRTTGVLVAASGEGKAHFVGYSELFFPRAGNYDVTVPGAERIEPESSLEFEYQDGVTQPLETVEAGAEIAAPAFSVGNLSFRRLFHSQKADLGGGVTANLRIGRDGAVTGVVTNHSGRTLMDSTIILPMAASWTANVTFLKIGDLPPGPTHISPGVPVRSWGTYGPDSYPGSPVRTQALRSERRPACPILLAQTTGETFGPNLGQWVGGEDTVTVMVGLPPIKNGKGGAAR
jgi:hypothetical protein